MKKLFYIILGLSITITSCELSETPKATLSEDVVFGNENGLKIYSHSFYRDLPNGTEAYKLEDMADYGAVNNLNAFIKPNGYSAETSSGWSWTELRNINHFISKNINPEVPQEVRDHYTAVARFFRAYFYFKKVVRFGDVPWVDRPLAVEEDDVLYADRDSRELVMSKIMEDLDFAYQHIQASKNNDGSEVTKWVALGLKTRIALFEASFRNYHTELGLKNTAQGYYEQVVSAAEILMSEGPHSIYTGAGVANSQRALFTSIKPVTSEVMLAVTLDQSLGVLGSANWWWTSPTYGPRYSLVRPFINTFLNTDGTPYTNKASYLTDDFYTETQDRDTRLQQLIRTPGYQRDGQDAAPSFNGYSYTGYQPIKYTLDASSFDNGALNNNAIPLMRYAEILLNYAEAKAELGTFNLSDWNKTIAVLRARAGITDVNSLPTQVDPYMKKTFYKDVSDPVLMEIRRERATELALEGFRFQDLIRWKEGHLMAELPWTGMYVPALNTLLDLDKNGKPDVIFYDGATAGPTIPVPNGTAKIAIGGKATNFQTLTSDQHLEWFKAEPRTWEDRQYYYPIPNPAIVKNDNLTQNPGWE